MFIGHVYLLISIDSDGTELFKIGLSRSSPENRVKQLQTGSAHKIDILRTYQSKYYRKIEQWLHGKYSHLKTDSGNEWFKLSNQDVLDFGMNCEKIEKDIEFLLTENYFYK
jgi:Meiotically up-regulated gene 113